MTFYRYKNGFFRLAQGYHEPTFTERTQERAYTIDDVVGTVGGYVGLFMGYALVQFPDILRTAIDFFKRK